MKKYLASLGLLTALVLLSACQSTNSKVGTSTTSTKEETTTVVTDADKSTSTSATKTPTSESETTKKTTASDEVHYQETLTKVMEDPSRTVTHYAFYDIDSNGTKELFTGIDNGGEILAAAVYYLKNGVSTYLADSATAQAGGRRASFQVNEDGTVSQQELLSGTGEGMVTLYRLRTDNSGVDILKEVEIEKLEPKEEIPSNNNPVDLSSLDWKQLELPTKENSKSSDSHTSSTISDSLNGKYISEEFGGYSMEISEDTNVKIIMGPVFGTGTMNTVEQTITLNSDLESSEDRGPDYTYSVTDDGIILRYDNGTEIPFKKE